MQQDSDKRVTQKIGTKKEKRSHEKSDNKTSAKTNQRIYERNYLLVEDERMDQNLANNRSGLNFFLQILNSILRFNSLSPRVAPITYPEFMSSQISPPQLLLVISYLITANLRAPQGVDTTLTTFYHTCTGTGKDSSRCLLHQ